MDLFLEAGFMPTRKEAGDPGDLGALPDGNPGHPGPDLSAERKEAHVASGSGRKLPRVGLKSRTLGALVMSGGRPFHTQLDR